MEVLMVYRDKLINVKKQIVAITGSGCSLTPAIIQMVNGHKCEVYFGYNRLEKGKMGRPYLRVAADYETGRILHFQNAYYSEFSDKEKYPLDKEMSLDVPVAKSVKEQGELLKRLERLYEKISAIAFSEFVLEENVKALKEYQKCLEDTVPPDLMAFMIDTETDFFQWMHQIVNE